MKRRIVLSVAAAALLVVTAVGAQAQTGFGLRAGQISVEGDNITMDASTAFGAHVALGFIPILKFQLGVEYLSGTATYNYTPGIAGSAFDADYKSVGIFLDVRKPIGLIPMFPLKLLVGGGLNMNLMSYLDEAAFLAGGAGEPTLEDFTQNGYHLMVGLVFKPPVLPFSISAEYRMQTIKLADENVKNNGLVLGLTFGF